MKKLPDGWKEVKLGEYFDVQLGKMLSEKARQGNQIPYLTNFNIRWGTFDLSHFNEMNFTAREKRKFEIKKNDLLMCEGGEVGRCAVWKKDDCQLYYQKALHRIRAIDDKKASTDYLYNYMNFICHSNKIVGFVGESSIAHLPREKLINIKIPLPPLAEQKAIAETLSVWDSAIEKTERLIQEKEKMFELSSKNILFGKKYETIYLKELLDKSISIQKGKNYIKTESNLTKRIPVVGGGKTFSRYVSDSNVKDNCITISASGAYAGYVWFHDYPIWASDCNIILANEQINLKYLFYVLKVQQEKIYLFQSGGAQPHIYKDDIMFLKVPKLTKDKQQQIAEILDLQQTEITLLTQQLSQYKLQKQGLMQKLLTGEWRIK